MTDQTTQAPAATADTAAAAGGGNGAQVQTSQVVPSGNWLSGLQDAENQKVATAKGWDKASSPDVVFQSYRELESRLGRSVVLPGKEATKQDYDAFASKVGRPAQPDGYEFKLPAALPEGLPYDDQSATEFKVWSHEAGLAPWQAQIIHDRFVEKQVKLLNGSAEQSGTKVIAAHSDIVKKWGPTDSPGYKTNVKHASRALSQLGLSETFRTHGLLSTNGEVTDAKLAFALSTIGEGLYKEDGRFGGPGALTQANPWKDGQENLSEQGRIARNEPELAKTLIQAAGKDPAKVLYR